MTEELSGRRIVVLMQTALMNVRFEGNNGHDADGPLCRLMTQSGHPFGRKAKRSAQGGLQQAKGLLSCDPRGCPAARYPVCESTCAIMRSTRDAIAMHALMLF